MGGFQDGMHTMGKECTILQAYKLKKISRIYILKKKTTTKTLLQVKKNKQPNFKMGLFLDLEYTFLQRQYTNSW